MSSVWVGEDLAETFAVAFDSWVGEVSIDDVNAWHDAHFVLIGDLSRRMVSSGTTELANAHLRGDLEDVYLALAALDHAFGYVHPRRGGPSSLDALARRYRQTGNFLSPGSSAGGGVIPRWVLPEVGNGLIDRAEDAFLNVRRVPADQWQRLETRRLSAEDDLPGGSLTGARPIRMVFSPVLHSIDDVAVEQGTNVPGSETAPWYNFGPSRVGAESIRRLIGEWDASGADVAMCPEGALDERTAGLWKAALLDIPRPPESKLRWILAGSGRWQSEKPGRPHNRAVLLGRDSGEILLWHDKFAPFNFSTPEQLETWGIEHVVAAEPPVYENIMPGKSAQVLESRAGRVAIMVCEDLTRVGHPVNDAVRKSGPALVFTPVFARETRMHYWEHQAAKIWLNLEGSSVAVCNSLVIPHAEAISASKRLGPRVPFCLLVTSGDPGVQLAGLESAESSAPLLLS